MNLPNKLTIFRICLVPFFVAALLSGFPHHVLVAGLLFGAAAYTDHLDGKLARKHGLITNFGKFMDPLADKVLVISALVCLVDLQLANVWFVILIIAREFLVTSLRLVAADSGQVIAANRWGKAKTVSQVVAIVLILAMQYVLELMDLGLLPAFTAAGRAADVLFGWIGDGLLLVAVVFTVLSGGVYLMQNRHVIRQTGR